MKKAAFHTLGCKLNFTETATIADGFKADGIEVVGFTENPDLFVINTCSVTDNADKKCRKVVKEARRISPNAEVYIIGCYAQLKPEEIMAIPGVSGVFGANEKFNILKQIKGGISSVPGTLNGLNFIPAYSSDYRTRLFFKVQDGCNYGCTFCTIPKARGKSRSTNSHELVKLAQEAIHENDSKELILTGVNIGDFGIIDGRRQERFIDLLKAMEDQLDISRIRISSIEPNLLSSEIIRHVASSEKFMPHFHIPLQSGSEKILSGMKRRYKRDLYKDRVKEIRSLMPEAGIGVDVIVGFPGEGISEFMETYQFIDALDVSYLHVFPYSERANTPAVEMKDSVPTKERARRAQDLRNLSDQKKKEFYTRNIGREMKVLFEQKEKNGLMLGFTENYIRVGIPYDPEFINEVKDLKIESLEEGLFCKGTEIPAKSFTV